jgi:hypothetical protein
VLLICCKKRNEAQATAPGFLASTFDMVDLLKLHRYRASGRENDPSGVET